MDKQIYREYVAILKEELQPAMGCTEPIAVAYCAALARQTLGALPETVEVLASANIIKNVKSVIVPNTNGLRGNYGANIGRILLQSYGTSVHNRAKAYAAAGSDARMNGCDLPVVINSGSGNQGLTASLPVIIYAKELDVTQEMLYRALAVSNLVTIHLKTGIGSLSAYCGATAAGCGAAAGVTYLYGGQFREIAHTVVNAVAIASGMICDGAKASCAAKIASAVEAGLLGMQMQMHESQFYGGDGIVVKGVENTIRNIGTLASEGMRETDRTIICMMIQEH